MLLSLPFFLIIFILCYSIAVVYRMFTRKQNRNPIIDAISSLVVIFGVMLVIIFFVIVFSIK